MSLLLNVGSGQRCFSPPWTNLDLVSRPGQIPDVIANGSILPFPDGSAEIVCLHHVLEHFGCGEGDTLIRECWRVLQSGGSLLVFVPDLWRLAQRWMAGQLDDYIYIVNLMGAFQGLESDRHRWHYTRSSLADTMLRCGQWSVLKAFDWRPLVGADIAKDFWVLGMEAVK